MLDNVLANVVECSLMWYFVSLENTNKTKNKREPQKQKFFIDGRLSKPVFKACLVKDKDNTRARCSVCHKTIELSKSYHLLVVPLGLIMPRGRKVTNSEYVRYKTKYSKSMKVSYEGILTSS